MKVKSTSREALLAKQDTKETDYNYILNSLSLSNGKTYLEIAFSLNWSNPNKVSKRMCELVRLKKVIELEPRICSIGKRRCTVYEILQ
jgi:UDP-N-acetylenolpyruvoylglucosamine reductase